MKVISSKRNKIVKPTSESAEDFYKESDDCVSVKSKRVRRVLGKHEIQRTGQELQEL